MQLAERLVLIICYSLVMRSVFLRKSKRRRRRSGCSSPSKVAIPKFMFCVLQYAMSGCCSLSNSPQCNNKCRTVSKVLQEWHRGLSLPWYMKECVKAVWPRRNLAKARSSRRVFLEDEDHNPILVLISCNCVLFLVSPSLLSKTFSTMSNGRPNRWLTDCYVGNSLKI